MPDETENQHFRELLGKLIDDEITEAEASELTRLAKENSAFNTALLEQLRSDEMLARYLHPDRAGDAFGFSVEATLDAEEDGADFVDRVLGSTEKIVPIRGRRRSSPLVLASAIAACLVIGLAIWPLPERGETSAPTVAVIETLVGELKHDGILYNEGDSLPPGQIDVTGYVALEFLQGARMNVGGPARLDLVDPQKVVCRYGKIRATVPEIAKGFSVLTAEAEIVDIGTEFAMRVDSSGTTEVHVIDGEVQAFDRDRDPESMHTLVAGNALKVAGDGDWRTIPAENAAFDDLERIDELSSGEEQRMMKRWRTVSTEILSDPRLVVAYDFERDPSEPRVLKNRAASGARHDGAIIGANWGRGPWGTKAALEFRNPGDRVRLTLDVELEAVTLATWIRVDGLDRDYSSMLLSDGFEPGEIHWQFHQDGTLIAGLHFENGRRMNFNGPEFMDLHRIGRWLHLVTVIDPQREVAIHYVNGDRIAAKKLRHTGTWNLAPPPSATGANRSPLPARSEI